MAMYSNLQKSSDYFLMRSGKAKYSNFVEKTRPIYIFNSQIFGRGSEIARFETAEKNLPDEVHEWTSF